MPKYLPGVTHHCVCMVKNDIDMKSMNDTLAFVFPCFGNDDTYIGPIRIKKMPGPTSGVVAELPLTPVIKEGKKSWMYVFKGGVGDEVKMSCLIAFDKVKQQFGMKFGKSYKVNEKTVEEVEKC